MKIVQINTFPYKATGAIMLGIDQAIDKSQNQAYVVWGRGRAAKDSHEIVIADDWGVKWHGLYTRITDRTGFASTRATKKLLAELDQIQPDIIHLHNIHGYYLNIALLFEYTRNNNIHIIWTLHDCWPFTGHCAYFDAVQCDKWKTGCCKCPQKKTYPASALIDASEWNWKKKKELFQNQNIVLVTPCRWLKTLVKQSFLKEYPVEVIYNGIDTSVFCPTPGIFRKKWNLQEKKIILGVASEWTERKGLKDFIKLNQMLHETGYQQFKIVLVGLTQKQIEMLPEDILAFKRTQSVQELVEIYSDADTLFNPTYEDNFPTTNMEAICCGTPVITYRTGGSPESIEASTGYVLEQGDLKGAVEILTSCDLPKLGKNINIDYVHERFSKEKMAEQYIEIYNNCFIRR